MPVKLWSNERFFLFCFPIYRQCSEVLSDVPQQCLRISRRDRNRFAGVYRDEQLNKPIRLFTADYVSRQLIGVTSQRLGNVLCFVLERIDLRVGDDTEHHVIGAESKVCELVDVGLKPGHFSGSVRILANAHLAQMGSAKVAWASVQKLQLHLKAHLLTAQELPARQIKHEPQQPSEWVLL